MSGRHTSEDLANLRAGGFVETADEIERLHKVEDATCAIADQAFLRRIVDRAWNEATESTAVPSTKWADRIIESARPPDLIDGEMYWLRNATSGKAFMAEYSAKNKDRNGAEAGATFWVGLVEVPEPHDVIQRIVRPE